MDVEKLISKVDLEDLAERAGAKFHQNGHKDLRSTCPIHGGHNPTAFSIYRDDYGIQRWYCYADCQTGGDAINFIQKWHGLDFIGAVKELADIYQIPLDEINFSQADAQAEVKRRERIDILDLAARYYQNLLWSPAGEKALAYIRGRGFTDDTIRKAHWGFSPVDTGLYNYLADQKANLSLAYETGIIRHDQYDFLANQSGKEAAPNGYIVYPHLVGEAVVYFSSRAVEVPGFERMDPKDKSRNLPGQRRIYRAEVPGQYDQVILVEGPADAESIRQTGVSAWALCGLGKKLADDDLNTLRRRRAVYLAPDTDKSGEKALDTGKVAELASDLGPLTLVMPPIPGAKDFNDWLNARPPAGKLNKEKLDEHILSSFTWIERRISQAKIARPYDRDERMMEVGRLVAQLPDTSKPFYFQRIQNELGLTRRDINELVGTALGKNDGKILSSIKDGSICFLGKPLGNFQARITHELTLDDGQDQPTVRYTLAGKLSSGQMLDSVDVEASEFSDMKWIAKCWGARPILYVGRGQYSELTRAIQEVSQDMKRERVYTYTGWAKIDGKRSFLSTSGRISQDGLDPSTRVDLGNNNLQFYSLPEPPSGETLFAAVKASFDFLRVAPRQITAILWAAMYAAPLTEAMALYAVIWVYGQTMTGKSTISHIALSHFGKGFMVDKKYIAPIEWISTQTSIEGAMFVTKDIPIIIDDYAPQNQASPSEAKTMAKTASFVVRTVGNRSSRGRSDVNLHERRTRIPRGMVISTAENPLTGQSTVGRMIYVPVAKEDAFHASGNPLLDMAQDQAEKGIYAQAMSAYIQWLAINWEKAVTDFKDQATIYTASIRKLHPEIQNRLHDYYGLLCSAQKLAIDCFMDMGLITQTEATAEIKANQNAIMEIMIQQAEMVNSESPVKKFFQAIGTLLDQGKVHLAPHSNDTLYYPPDNKSELIGWYDTKNKNVIYLMTEVCLARAREYWLALEDNLAILPDALRRQILQQPTLLAKSDQRQAEASVYIRGKTKRVLALNLDKVEALYGVQMMEGKDE